MSVVRDTLDMAGRQSASIGSDAACDLVLADAAVAPSHARIENRDGRYTVAPVETAHVLVNGRAIAIPTVLYANDRIRLGPFTLVYEQGVIAPTRRLRDVEPTPATGERGRTAGEITIGRSPDSTVPLAEPAVSWEHAVVRRHGDTAVLHDLRTPGGTFVNGERMGQHQLVAGDRVQVGPAQLVWDGGAFTRVDAPGGVSIDATGLRRIVGGGRVILDVPAISIRPNELVAIVGGSGSGKSTLLTALAGFQPADAGTVLVNGSDLYAEFDALRSSIGYVPQQDIVHRPLTVERVLHYVAELRLPRDISKAERAARIAQVLSLVDLGERATTRIDQLSGGQVKRVSIAVELLAGPRVLFLDEPTSGLDPGLDRRLMDTFRDLADDGRTVVVVTHATANIRVCDRIAFMAPGGFLACFGTPDEVLETFGVTDFADVYPLVESGRRQASPPQPAPPPAVVRPRAAQPPPGDERAQFATMTRRYAEIVLRDRRNTLALVLQAPAIGLLVALAAQHDAFVSGRIGDRQTVAFVLAVVATWFGSINAAREITKELAIVRRERMAGIGIRPYIASKVAVLGALVAIQTLLLLPVVLARTGIPPGHALGPPALSLFITLTLTGLAATGFGLVVSALAENEDRAISLIPLLLIPQFLLGGVIFQLTGILDLASYLTTTRWATQAVGSIVDVCGPRGCPSDVLDYQQDAGQVVPAWIALAVAGVALPAIAGFLVRRRDPHRR